MIELETKIRIGQNKQTEEKLKKHIDTEAYTFTHTEIL